MEREMTEYIRRKTEMIKRYKNNTTVITTQKPRYEQPVYQVPQPVY